MALKFGAQEAVTDESIEMLAPLTVSDLMCQLLKECRPDWGTVTITIEPDTFRDGIWVFRLRAYGGTRECKVRGG